MVSKNLDISIETADIFTDRHFVKKMSPFQFEPAGNAYYKNRLENYDCFISNILINAIILSFENKKNRKKFYEDKPKR